MPLGDFDTWTVSAGLPDDFDFSEWLKFFTGAEWRDAGDMFKLKSKDLKLKVFAHGDSEFVVLAESKRFASRRVALIFSFPQYPDSHQKQMLRILDSCIASIALTEPQAGKEKEIKKIAGPSGKKSSDGQESDACRESRERVIASIKNMSGWWYMETEHFVIVSNIKRRKDINFFKNEVDKIYDVYQKIVPPLAPIRTVGVIRIFDDRKEYIAYTEQKEWSAGVFMPSKDELAFFFDPDANKKEQAYQRKLVLHHEMFHQYLHQALGEIRTDVWFNEGSAKFFELTVCKSGGKYSIPIDRDFLDWARKMLDTPYADVRRLLALSYEEFYEDYKHTYNAAFALMVFLAKGAQQIKSPELRAKYLAIPYLY